MKQAVSVSLKLSFGKKLALEQLNERLQKLVRQLEKKFHDAIWYIGIDMFQNSLYQRFMFNKGGFMEIKLAEKPIITAYFRDKKKADKFKSALKKAIEKIKKKQKKSKKEKKARKKK